MQKFLYTFLFISFFGFISNAQRVDGLSLDNVFGFGPSSNELGYARFSNYHFFNPYYYNPAMAGIEGEKKLNFNWNRESLRSWRREYGRDYFLSYEQAIPSINSGLGIFARHTDQSDYQVINYGMAYNYGFTIKEKSLLKLGFQISQMHFRSEFSNFGRGISNMDYPRLDLGVAFKKNKLRLGVSYQDLFPKEITWVVNALTPAEYFYTMKSLGRRLNISGAYTFGLAKKWDFHASCLLRKPSESEWINDFTYYLDWHKRIYFGYTLRTNVEHPSIIFIGLKPNEKINLHFSFNAQKEEDEPRTIETLMQYQF